MASHTDLDNHAQAKKALIVLAVLAVVAAVLFFLTTRGGDDDDKAADAPKGDAGSVATSVLQGDTPGDSAQSEGDDLSAEETEKAEDSTARPDESVTVKENPLPGENVAKPGDPDSPTVYGRYLPNVSSYGEGDMKIEQRSYGDMFANPVPRDENDRATAIDKKLPVDVRGVDLKNVDARNNEGAQAAKEAVQTLLNFRTRNYASVNCAVAGGGKEISTPGLHKRFLRDCQENPIPSKTWESYIDHDVSLHVASMKLYQQGNGISYAETDFADKVSRAYLVDIHLVDGEGRQLAINGKKDVSMQVFIAMVKRDGKWLVDEFATRQNGRMK